jgi:hypothetical protein
MFKSKTPKNKEKIKTLVNHKGVELKDEDGYSILHELGSLGHTEILNHKLVAKMKDVNGDTPLHTLLFDNDENLTKKEKELALSHPQANKVKNNSGLTPAYSYWR